MLKRLRTSPVSKAKVADTVTEELIYGALRREGQWKVLGLSGMGFGAVMAVGMMMLALSHETPAPALVPFDPAEPPRVYRRVCGSMIRLLFRLRSSLRRRPPLLRSA